MSDDYDFFNSDVEFQDNYDDVEFQDNFKDLERVGFGINHPLLTNTKFGEAKGGGENMAKMQDRMFKINATDEEKFAHILQALFYQYKDELKLDTESLGDMLDAVEKIPNIYYKNPLGYLLGYYIVDIVDKRGRKKIPEINGDKLKKMNELIETMDDMTEVDLIRYSRLWLNRYESE